MADYALALVSILVLAGAVLLAWRALRGSAASPGRRLGRVAPAVLVALIVTGVITYSLTRSRTFQLAGELVSRVETTDKVVALTLDDGPTREHTQDVLDILKAKGVRATFYLSGRECEQDPAMLKAIIAAGHELGNHSYSGRRMVFLSGAAVAGEVERTDAVFRAAGYAATTTFRPPGCKKLLTAPLYLAGNDRTTVTWDLEPDSLEGIAGDADAMTSYVADGVRPGSIVLMHVMYDSRESSRVALPRIIEQLSDAGYRFVTVSELLALRAD
jgi:peptidoglycan/xylan/chitin deacetylase (PgdA/CDA1 family)